MIEWGGVGIFALQHYFNYSLSVPRTEVMPQTSNYVVLHGQRDFADVAEVKTFRGIIQVDLMEL